MVFVPALSIINRRMRSIRARFEECEKRNPELSSFVNFSRAIRNQAFGFEDLRRGFNRLVDRNDYSSTDKKELLRHLESLNKPEEPQK